MRKEAEALNPHRIAARRGFSVLNNQLPVVVAVDDDTTRQKRGCEG